MITLQPGGAAQGQRTTGLQERTQVLNGVVDVIPTSRPPGRWDPYSFLFKAQVGFFVILQQEGPMLLQNTLLFCLHTVNSSPGFNPFRGSLYCA